MAWGTLAPLKTRRELRREKRKEARLHKRKNQHSSWFRHKNVEKRESPDLEQLLVERQHGNYGDSNLLELNSVDHSTKGKKRKASSKKMSFSEGTKSQEFRDMETEVDLNLETERKLAKKLKIKGGKLGGVDDSLNDNYGDSSLLELNSVDHSTKGKKRKASSKKKSSSEGTKSQGFRDMETEVDLDLETERKLAKKLKIKGGKLGGVDDGLNDLLGDISFMSHAWKADHEIPSKTDDYEQQNGAPSTKKHKKKKHSVASEEQSKETTDTVQLLNFSDKEHGGEVVKAKDTKYVPPHLQSSVHIESEDLAHIRRRVRGLLNRLSESNVESITEEISNIFRSIPRSDGSRIVCEIVISSCINGPRGNEQHAAVFAAFIAGMACLVGIDFSAKLLVSLAMAYENEYAKEDNLSLRNITLLLSYLYIFNVCSSDLIYDFMSVLSKRMTESDVSTILAIIQCCGMKLRSDDPTAMKDFILAIQNRVSELKCSLGTYGDSQLTMNNKRMEFMLETIFDIKNNKRCKKEESACHTRIKKWLQKLKADDILLRGIKWTKLLDPEKKGQWWLSGEITSVDNNIKDVSVTIDKGIVEAQKLIQLAACLRMNTDIRKAIFCVIMSGEDYIDAFEKILRLDLSGKQDREIMRVLVECCLQEKVFNKYYVALASKLCSHNKNHKFTLQYCIWDHFKEVDSMEVRRSMNLAKFVAEMVSSFTLSLALLKAVDLADPKQLTPKRIMHFCMFFETLFEKTDATVWNIFTRVAALPERDVLGMNLEFFIKRFVLSSCSGNEHLFTAKFCIAKKALDNVVGVLM